MIGVSNVPLHLGQRHRGLVTFLWFVSETRPLQWGQARFSCVGLLGINPLSNMRGRAIAILLGGGAPFCEKC